MRVAWRLLDPRRLDDSMADWLQAALVVIEAQHGNSALLAAAYLAAFREAELGGDAGGFEAVLSEGADRRAALTSLVVTGPVSIKSAMRRSSNLGQAMAVAQARTARAAMRHALAGGRETLTRSIQSDRRAAGYRRVTSGKACDFCSLLAGRGAVYGVESARFAAHDGCSCSAEPVFVR